jgi:plasmid stability protein
MMIVMRTTVNLDEDLASVLKKAARRGGQSFTAVVNETLRAGLTKRGVRPRPRRYRLEPAFLGGASPGLDLDRALRLSDALEEREIAEKLVRHVNPLG